jgi:hypothetical protein
MQSTVSVFLFLILVQLLLRLRAFFRLLDCVLSLTVPSKSVNRVPCLNRTPCLVNCTQPNCPEPNPCLVTPELPCLGVGPGLSRDAIRTPSGGLRWRPSGSVGRWSATVFVGGGASGFPGRARWHLWSVACCASFPYMVIFQSASVHMTLSDSRPTVSLVPLHDCLNLNYFGRSLSGHPGVSAPFSV